MTYFLSILKLKGKFHVMAISLKIIFVPMVQQKNSADPFSSYQGLHCLSMFVLKERLVD